MIPYVTYVKTLGNLTKEEKDSYTDDELDVDQPFEISQRTEPTMRDNAKIEGMVLEAKEKANPISYEDSSPI